jgi:hypothetical protein
MYSAEPFHQLVVPADLFENSRVAAALPIRAELDLGHFQKLRRRE